LFPQNRQLLYHRKISNYTPRDSTSSVALGDTLRVTAEDIGPIDISTLTSAWSGNIKKIWLEFTGSGNLSSNVRIGWVKLTE
jgi:hypothetical protein